MKWCTELSFFFAMQTMLHNCVNCTQNRFFHKWVFYTFSSCSRVFVASLNVKPQSAVLKSHITAEWTPVVQPSCLHTQSSQMSRPTSSDVRTKVCSTCLGMFAVLPWSCRVICRPDFGVAKVKDGSKSGFRQKAGSATINTALGVVCIPIPGHLLVCMSSWCANLTPSSVNNHPRRKWDVEQRAEKKRNGNHGVMPAFSNIQYF